MTTPTSVMAGIAPPPALLSRINVGDLLRRAAQRDPEKIFLVDGDTRLSYGELNRRATQAANALLASGLRPGARVASLCNNSAEFIAAFFGVHRAGLVWVPINTGLGLDDVRYIIEHAEAGAVLVDGALLEREPLRELLDQHGPATGFVIEGGARGRYASFAAAFAAQTDVETPVEAGDRDVAQIMYTSGTTGRPKGVMQCHTAVVMAAFANAIELGMQREDVANAMLPLFHCAQHTLLCSMLVAGGRAVLLRAFDPTLMLELIERERVSKLFALPLMYQAMLDHSTFAQRDVSSLKLCLYAMAPMPETLLRKLIERFCPQFMLASGQTEMYPLTVTFRPEEQLRRFGPYWGVSSILNDTAVMDDEGRILGRGEVGEIVHRGPNVMQGYYKDPEATAKARAFGWHHTGDLGMWDADGQLLFKDRKKDMIKTGGENVPSVKVEAVLLQHPAVANAAAVGLPHARWIEAVTVFVVLKPGASTDEPTLIAHCKAFLGGFEVPKAIRVLDALPMTSTGKVQKQPLRERFQNLYAD